jgi:inhibitor of the pro-sigma K processing machinery
LNSFTVLSIVLIACAVLFFTALSGWKPVKWIGWIAGNLVIGSILLFLVNLAGESFSLAIPINPVTATVAGFLGLPGLATLILIKLFCI